MIAPHSNCFRALIYSGFCLLLLMSPRSSAQETALEPVTLQLKWMHQFQFAGYYMALERGYYREAGLDVTIVAGGPDVVVADEVLSGRADFGVGTSELLLDFAAGKPVVVLGVVYQHSPLALVVRTSPDVHSLRDLVGHTVMIEASSPDLITMLKMEGVGRDQLTLIPHDFDPEDWSASHAVAASVYVTDEPYLLDQTGIEYLLYYPRNYGIDFYGDNFFTRADLVEARPEQVRRFQEATVRGWRDARDDPYAAIDLILAKYDQRKNRAHLLYEANKTIDLMTNLVAPGHMEKRRWDDMRDTYLARGVLETAPNLDAFLWRAPGTGLPHWFTKLALITAGALLLLSALAFYLHTLNQMLKQEVARRLASELALRESRDTLQQALSEVKTLKEILPICSFCKKIRDDGGYWEQLETYISEHAGTDFSHGICPECMKTHYPEDQ